MGVTDVVTARALASSRKSSDKQVAETLQLLAAHGVRRGANAIHIEPQADKVVIRYRVDGALRGMHKLPLAAMDPMIGQLKKMADLDSGDNSAPQEGRFAISVKDQPVEVRLATMPVMGGEKAVLHLTPQHGVLGELEELGFWGESLELLHDALARAHGLVLVNGPRQSGKTTTLYGLLQILNNPAHSIATVEERPSHRLPGVSQSYVARGTDLDAGLQAALRQDPNVIMIGGLPGRQAVDLAVHASVTGHMLMAELHDNDAASGIAHIRTLCQEPFLLATGLRLSIGQRLVRMLCPDCREPYVPDDAERSYTEKQFGINNDANRARLHELELKAKQLGIGSGPANTSAKTVKKLWRASQEGCANCDRTGYKGRIAIVEVLPHTEQIQKLLMKHDPPTPGALHKAALQEGFIPMGLDGLVKVLRGLTTTSEVLRVLPRHI